MAARKMLIHLLVFLFIFQNGSSFLNGFQSFVKVVPSIKKDWQLNALSKYREALYQKRINPGPFDPKSDRPYITRPLRWPDRQDLEYYNVGDKHRGLIISVRK
jgi:hypothetical protein